MLEKMFHVKDLSSLIQQNLCDSASFKMLVAWRNPVVPELFHHKISVLKHKVKGKAVMGQPTK